MIFRALFVLVVLEAIRDRAAHANHVRHHHNLANYHHNHHRNADADYDNDYFDNSVKSDNEKVDELSDDDDYYEYMNDLNNQQEEIAVGDFHSRSTSPDTDFDDYGDNDKETVYEPPDVSMLFDFMATGCNAIVQ